MTEEQKDVLRADGWLDPNEANQLRDANKILHIEGKDIYSRLTSALSAQAAAEAEVATLKRGLQEEIVYMTSLREQRDDALIAQRAAEQRAAGMESATIERCAKALDDVQPHCAAIIRALSQPHGEANG